MMGKGDTSAHMVVCSVCVCCEADYAGNLTSYKSSLPFKIELCQLHIESHFAGANPASVATERHCMKSTLVSWQARELVSRVTPPRCFPGALPRFSPGQKPVLVPIVESVIEPTVSSMNETVQTMPTAANRLFE
jgi:hypothetical protein